MNFNRERDENQNKERRKRDCKNRFTTSATTGQSRAGQGDGRHIASGDKA
ncbi:MAG: hypothetical protein LBO72_09900 [Helicobacteraceae bacterium]|nr:hypothetical protein [Helicobacteraceae bacterium]